MKLMQPLTMWIVRIGLALLLLSVSVLSGRAQSEIITISTVAGNGTPGFGGFGGPATAAGLGGPSSVAVDAAGNLFVAEIGSFVGSVRKVTAGGLIVEGTAFYGIVFVAADEADNLFVADESDHLVWRVTPAGVMSAVAGNGTMGFSGDGGPATSTQLNGPHGVAVDAAGNLFIADSFNHRVRKVTPDGVISTIAGNGTMGFSGDGGPATSAQLNIPLGVAVDAASNLFIADSFNHRVRKVTPDGVISTIAGNGAAGFSGDGGPPASAQLNIPLGVAVDAAGNLFIADSFNHRVRKVTPGGVISTVAGNGAAGFSGDGGPATSAQLNGPVGVAVDTAGNLFIADSGNHRVRKVWSRPAGDGEPGGSSRDFNGDSQVDILWRDTAGNVSMWLMNGHTITNNSFIANIWTGWTIIGSGDFNADGKADILWRDTGGNVATWLMDGVTITSFSKKPGNMPISWAVVGIADFNGDGKADILWRDTGGNVLVWLMNGHTIANFSLIANVWTGWRIVGTGDFNGDGKADILWRDTAGSVAIWLMDGTTIASFSNTGNMPAVSTIVAIGDFNGNGTADILWRDTVGNVSIWLMSGHTITDNSFIANIWTGWTIVGSGDFNGDRRTDILWRDTAGNVTIWLMDGNFISSFRDMGNVSDRTPQ